MAPVLYPQLNMSSEPWSPRRLRLGLGGLEKEDRVVVCLGEERAPARRAGMADPFLVVGPGDRRIHVPAPGLVALEPLNVLGHGFTPLNGHSTRERNSMRAKKSSVQPNVVITPERGITQSCHHCITGLDICPDRYCIPGSEAQFDGLHRPDALRAGI